MVKSTDPSTMVSVAQMQEAIQDWECERLRSFIRRNFESRYRDVLSSVPTASRVMHPRAKRGKGRYLNDVHTGQGYVPHIHTGKGKKMVSSLREFFRQVRAEVVSNSRNKLHETWGQFFSPSLY